MTFEIGRWVIAGKNDWRGTAEVGTYAAADSIRLGKHEYRGATSIA